MSSTFGTTFRISTFGESHGVGLGAVVDGCPAGLELSAADLQSQLDRRRPGSNPLGTPRDEADAIQILSGVDQGLTLGTPIALAVLNSDQRPGDYAGMADAPRPSHADYTYRAKYGHSASSGGGRASARETLARVAAAGIAEKLLGQWYGTEIVAWVSSVGAINAPDLVGSGLTRSAVDGSDIRCPDAETAAIMTDEVKAARSAGDSCGGVVTCEIRNVPVGLGEPVFDKAEALLAHAMLSIPATKGFEIGSGFSGVTMRGSAHNDMYEARDGGQLGTVTNRSGGVQGGITTGESIYFRVAFKPTATIASAQESVDFEGKPVTVKGAGRHDPCVLPRAIPIVESMAALVLADLALRARLSQVQQ